MLTSITTVVATDNRISMYYLQYNFNLHTPRNLKGIDNF